RQAVLAVLVGLVGWSGVPRSGSVRAQPRAETAPPVKNPPAEQPLKLPANWNPRDPLPVEKTNCVRCHLTAGRELTVPVRDFARSVHDRASLSCNDCHGGNIKEDSTAHESEHGFIGTKLSAHMNACTA